jgi:molecular chaperone GrpE (heat shock protein)
LKEEQVNMGWNDDRQARLDALRSAELTGTLDEAGRAELAALIEVVEAEERERLALALDKMQAEQAALRQQVQDSAAANEQLVTLAAQQEQLLADVRRLLRDLQRRHQAIREAYQHVTGEPLSVVT